MNAIAHAVETFEPPESASLSSSYHKDTSNNSTGSFSVFKAPSISSLETGLTNMSSGSLGSAYSYGSRHSLGSMNSLKAKERRRRRRLPTRVSKASPDEGERLFQCTFCTDTFKSKYDWYVKLHPFPRCSHNLLSAKLRNTLFILSRVLGLIQTDSTDLQQVSARKESSSVSREVALRTSGQGHRQAEVRVLRHDRS
jgi:hypothetical protein